MGLFVDCALVEEVARLAVAYPLAGVTTNPTITLEAAEAGQRLNGPDLARELLAVCRGPVLAQPTAQTAGELRALGERWAAVDPTRVALKLPMTPAGLEAGMALQGAGLRVAFTAVTSLPQAYLGATAGADWIIPYFSRLRRAGIDADDRIRGMARLLQRLGCPTRLLVASVKSSADVVEAALEGAHDITARPEVIRALVNDPLTEAAVAQFATDAARGSELMGGGS